MKFVHAQTDSALVLAYAHIVVQIKNITYICILQIKS